MLYPLTRKLFPPSRLLKALVLCCVIFPSLASAAQPEPRLTVIVHSQVTYDELSRSMLRSIFTMRLTRWEDGTPIKVFVLADDDPVHRRFSKKALAVFPYQLRQTWDRAVFSGTGTAPFVVEDQNAMLNTIAATPGAIGYVVGNKDREGVRYVVVE